MVRAMSPYIDMHTEPCETDLKKQVVKESLLFFCGCFRFLGLEGCLQHTLWFEGQVSSPLLVFTHEEITQGPGFSNTMI